MIEGARRLPLHHITIRVPWHDDGWQGTICQNPCGNSSCTILPRIGTGRDDGAEQQKAGQSLADMEPAHRPPCVDEHGTFMAPFPLGMNKRHPYAESAVQTHGHFAETAYSIQPYSVAAIPFRWMLREQVEGNDRNGIVGKSDRYALGYEDAREPDLTSNDGWKDDRKTWLQEGRNQRVLLDTFFSALRPEESLVFFYAKRTPMTDDPRRVIIGVGRVRSVGGPTEYRYQGGQCPPGRITGYLWERNVTHSIRPERGEGFLLPYQSLLRKAEADDGIDLEACTAFAPDASFENYSYASELLPHDGAIASLLAIEKAINAMRAHLDAPWEECLAWVDAELNRLWKARGAWPGLGPALGAFGFAHGNLLAWYLQEQAGELGSPWAVLERVLEDSNGLPDYLRADLGSTFARKLRQLPVERRALLELVARLEISDSQALRWYQPSERSDAGIAVSDSEILENPYLIYEEDRLQLDAVPFDVVDRGLFPVEQIRKAWPLPAPSAMADHIDPRRVRAVMIDTLEAASTAEGHTLLPEDWFVSRVRARPLRPECPIDIDTLPLVESFVSGRIRKIELADAKPAFQLELYHSIGNLIASTVRKRRQGARHQEDHDWQELVNKAINPDSPEPVSKRDAEARSEKARALEEVFRSRISVLMGGAGTGKSTLLKALCSLESVSKGGVLLLAPTGKARVRLEQTSGRAGEGKTIAQFLHRLQRYNGETGRYYVNPGAAKSSSHRTVVVDECSMLTEEQLAALLDALQGVERLILVGDPRQLPPIGAGRPFADIVRFLCPENVQSISPRVANGYAELMVTMRQGAGGDDTLLAAQFNGAASAAGDDEVWHNIAAGTSTRVRCRKWSTGEQLHQILLEEVVSELGLESVEDEVGFETSLGGNPSEYKGQTNVFFNTAWGNRPGAAEKAENWQVLSPIRPNMAGVVALNRMIQHRFRRHFIERANQTGWQRSIPSPAGPEGIIYGDKVINVINSGRRRVYPDRDDKYVANGDIGIVTGIRRTAQRKIRPDKLEVELATQPGHAYTYNPWEFSGQESTPPLELAYVLTVHKSQGSEFGLTFLIVPTPCRPLSREMLYTALTRHKNRVIILHQGDFRDLREFTHDTRSDLARRLTSLFSPAAPKQVKLRNGAVFLDENLIYMTAAGHLVRSKSEWIIADRLHAAGVDYQYEQPLMLAGIERYPDFTIVDDDAGVRWYWEHNGLMDDPAYAERWERKLAAYRSEGILPLEEGGGPAGTLLITEEKRGQGLNGDRITSLIQSINGY